MTESYYEFPCEYPIKVVGPASNQFESKVITIIETHVEDLPSHRISRKWSKNKKYLSLTFTIKADNLKQVEAIYKDLKTFELVFMTL